MRELHLTINSGYNHFMGPSIMQSQANDSLEAVARLPPPSFNKWLDMAFAEEKAATKIQFFFRDCLNQRHLSDPSVQRRATKILNFDSASVPEELDEDHQYDVLLLYGSSLGTVILKSCEITGYPCVKVAEGNDYLPGMWNLRKGDFLISVNDQSVKRSKVPFCKVLQILDSGVRPAVLRFRRPVSHELQCHTKRPRHLSIEARTDRQKRRERLERSMGYFIWREEDGPLKISLKAEAGKCYPVIMDMDKSGAVGRTGNHNKVRIGDQLLTINHCDVFRLGFDKMCQVMKFAPKPLVLTFRRMSLEPITAKNMRQS